LGGFPGPRLTMSTHDDDIEFDFFDEPETQEATQRRRLPRLERSPRGEGKPPRPPLRPGPGLTPLLRLLGLVALLIFVVVVLVFWVQSCQGASKRSSYEDYMRRVTALAQQSDQIGQQFQQKLTTPGIKRAQLATALDDLARQQQQEVTQAQSIRPPGPLRLQHAHMLESLQLRATGISHLADALRQGTKDTTKAGLALAQQAELLTASDVLWSFFFHDPTAAWLHAENITGVAVPGSTFIQSPDLVTGRSMTELYARLLGASTGGKPSGKHGDGLLGVTAQPQNLQLSTTTPTTIRASTDLSFQVKVQDSGCCQEVSVPVKLTIQASPTPIVKQKTIPLIGAGETKIVTFTDIGQPPFGSKTNIKVEVAPVAGETNLSNNSATYPVFFSIG
jgi:hypothetical protein